MDTDRKNMAKLDQSEVTECHLNVQAGKEARISRLLVY